MRPTGLVEKNCETRLLFVSFTGGGRIFQWEFLPGAEYEYHYRWELQHNTGTDTDTGIHTDTGKDTRTGTSIHTGRDSASSMASFQHT